MCGLHMIRFETNEISSIIASSTKYTNYYKKAANIYENISDTILQVAL